MFFIWSLIVGGILGWLASLIPEKNIPDRVVSNAIAGIIGSWIGSSLFNKWGPVIGGFAIIPALIGSIVFIVIISLILLAMNNTNTSKE
ncbi:GlsB/YeaQ/YmgE family stress response membrane protein [Bacillus cereus]|uniref:GlsB/YeaQ/YmgE family stress response membrane protein n=1 Tax=Bacillus cereus TaxID=1396 RepID=UPI001926A9E6|nr:GlsB/YeaQ/YmgE family stress response membrane protein [Bacillus cereus]MBL3741315.1 GlsB/YeaQ/YmgE family stress response membrane protein [Bacillus cereus]MBL3864125.1 GlsB/YeaQ/YmgE family stress response membrane protein [Bacillus cereus]HDR6770140.1 GlsB/YeaQ/YmgE family stress response membrane protein [Bacillus cereus]